MLAMIWAYMYLKLTVESEPETTMSVARGNRKMQIARRREGQPLTQIADSSLPLVQLILAVEGAREKPVVLNGLLYLVCERYMLGGERNIGQRSALYGI